MHIAILTFDVFNELDSLIALGLLLGLLGNTPTRALNHIEPFLAPAHAT